MASTFKNTVTIVGALEDVDLEIKEYKDKVSGEPYNAIVGSYTLKSGDQNVSLRTFYRDKNSKGPNRNFDLAAKWMEEPEAYKGTRYRMSTNISSNPFVGRDGNVVDATQIQGNFLNDAQNASDKAEFLVDLLLTKSPIEEVDQDGNATGRYLLNAEIFDFRDTCFPARFVIDSEAAFNYFEGLGATPTEPVLIEAWGQVVNNFIKHEIVTESAFGDAHVDIRETSRRENIITGASVEPKEMTEELATIIKKGREAYQVQKSSVVEKNTVANKPSGFGAATTTAKSNIATGNKFNF